MKAKSMIHETTLEEIIAQYYDGWINCYDLVRMSGLNEGQVERMCGMPIYGEWDWNSEAADYETRH
jgi:hypothetical protein